MYATMFFRIKVEGFWCARNSKPCLQAWAFPYYGKLTHGRIMRQEGGWGAHNNNLGYTKANQRK